MSESEKEQVISMLRACLLSTKGGIPLSNLERDYKMIVGERIPYYKLGYSSLEHFVQSIPNVATSRGRNGEMILDAIPTKSSEHVAELVSKQRSAPKKLSRSLPPRRSASWRPPPSAMTRRPRRSPPRLSPIQRLPLSVTFSNRVENRSFESDRSTRTVTVYPPSCDTDRDDSERKRSRTPGFFMPLPSSESNERKVSKVSIQNTPSTETNNNGVVSGKGPSFNSTFEVPPRFKKMAQEKVAAPVPPPVEYGRGPRVQAQDRLQRAVSSASMNKNNMTSGTIEPIENKPAEMQNIDRTITSPLTPLQLRLSAAAKKPPANVENSLEERLSSASIAGGDDYISQLERYVMSRGKSKPTFKVIPRMEKNTFYYSCSVKIDDVTSFSSYPDERSIPEDAMQLVAKMALDKLSESTSAVGGSVAHEDENKIKFRIQQIVNEHHSGIWASQIPIDYKVKYKDNLPEDWIKIATQCAGITVEHVTGNRTILSPNWPSETVATPVTKFNTARVESFTIEVVIDAPDNSKANITVQDRNRFHLLQLVLSVRWMYGENYSRSSSWSTARISELESSPVAPPMIDVTPMENLSRPLLSPLGPAIPEQLVLPDDDVWDIYITCGSTTDEIWGRLIGDDYSVKYENLATDMEMFYMGKNNIAVNPEVGMFYALKTDDICFRVELIEILENGSEGRVFFIDHGDEEIVELKELLVLERRFARLAAQAIPFYLWGLEDFADDPNAGHHLTDTIVGKSLVCEVKSRPRPDNPVVGVILFDTSTDEDLNVNSLLIENISKEAPVPQLPLEGKVQEVFISHVTDTGDIYLQFDSYNYLQRLVSDVVETGMKENSVVKGAGDSSSNPNRLYLARYHLDGNWYRAAITRKLEGSPEVEVLFVDFGNTEIINPDDLIVLETVKKAVADFPHQAIKVHLQNVPCSLFNERIAQRVRELVPFDEKVLVKTVSSGRSTNSVPVVEIFKRIQPDNLLVSINETLKYEPDLRADAKSPTEEIGGIRSRKRLDRLLSITSNEGVTAYNVLHSPTGSDSGETTSTRGLPPPQVPPIKEYFDVHVTMAANPSNFTVQPYKDAKKLEEMMENMQAHYKQQKLPHPSAESIQEGGLYAAYHNDGHWYRVCVSKVIGGSMVSVYFCDFGDVSVMTVDKLRPLMDQFKVLPYQAIKAKLAGIQPKHSDWSVEDCLMFQELVVEHQFVSVVVETGPDLLNPSDTVIGLKLIDTSGSEDVYIDQLLISQERAVSTMAS